MLDYTRTSGMKSTAQDREPVKLADASLERCTEYVYLGVFFLVMVISGPRLPDNVRRISTRYVCTIHRQKIDFPFWVKWKVFRAAFLSRNPPRGRGFTGTLVVSDLLQAGHAYMPTRTRDVMVTGRYVPGGPAPCVYNSTDQRTDADPESADNN